MPNSSLSAQLERIRRKIADCEVKLCPPTTKDCIETFESHWKVSLPEDYRRFLLEVGDGGDGPPAYGLCSLSGTTMGEDRTPLRPDLPFPLTQAWVWEGEVSYEGGGTPEVLVPVFPHGHLNLGTDGCAIDWILVVTGAERGQIWQRVDVGAQPCAPRRNFVSWYEYWLDGGDDWWAEFQ